MLKIRQEALFLVPVVALGAVILRSVFLAERPPPIVIENFVQAQSLRVDSASSVATSVVQNARSLAPGLFAADDFIYFTTSEVGQSVVFDLPLMNPGDYSFILHLAQSGDFGTVRLYINDNVAVDSVDLYTQGVGAIDVEAGTHRLSGNADQLRMEVTGANPESQAPHYQMGFDGVQIIPVPLPDPP